MIDTIVLKVAAPCNLRCTYCYEYQAGDSSWERMPKHLDVTTAERLGSRIAEYAGAREMSRFQVMLHGGEPLLLGQRKLEAIVGALRRCAAPVDLRIGMQTNAVLIDEDIAAFVKDNRIKVGVSLDGGAAQNKRRIDLAGRPTFERALAGYRLLEARAPECLSGLLTVIDLANDPADTVSFLCALKPKQLDLLLPFETHDTLGANREGWAERLDAWLHRAFEAWFFNRDFAPVKIRIFEDVMQALITRSPRTDWFGPRRVSYLVVATNGEIDTLDHLKVIGAESAAFRGTDADVFRHSLAEAESAAAALLDRVGATALPTGCGACPLRDVCCGGYLPHRYSSARTFDNPSVACTAITGMFRRFLPIMNARVGTASHVEGAIIP